VTYLVIIKVNIIRKFHFIIIIIIIIIIILKVLKNENYSVVWDAVWYVNANELRSVIWKNKKMRWHKKIGWRVWYKKNSNRKRINFFFFKKAHASHTYMYASHQQDIIRQCVACIVHASQLGHQKCSVTRNTYMRRMPYCMRRIYMPDSKIQLITCASLSQKVYNSLPIPYTCVQHHYIHKISVLT